MIDAERETYNAMVLEIDAWRKAATRVVESTKCLGKSQPYVSTDFDAMEELKAMVES